MSDFWKILNGMNLLFFIDKNNSVQNFDIYNAQRQAHKVFIKKKKKGKKEKAQGLHSCLSLLILKMLTLLGLFSL